VRKNQFYAATTHRLAASCGPKSSPLAYESQF
jgi:hypothetical protein